jgi:hypothetical protein
VPIFVQPEQGQEKQEETGSEDAVEVRCAL